MYILVVDDDPIGNNLVRFILNSEGFEVETLDNPRNAMQLIQKREPHLLLLDVLMPYVNGFEFTNKLRAEGYNIPLIFLTCMHSIDDKLRGFGLGADDYICKPFHHQELLARVMAVMRRNAKNGMLGNQSVCVGQFELLPAELKLLQQGHQAINLTHTEMQVLRLLMTNKGQIVQRGLFLKEVWHDDESTTNIVDVYIRRLRSKLEADAKKPQHLLSIRGVGYKFV